MSYPTTGLFHPVWYIGKKLESTIKSLCKGSVLNFPCGMSRFGDVNADLDPSVNPDIIADLLDRSTWPWSPRSFDTVVCDPPFGFYTTPKIGYKWQQEIKDLASSRMIFRTPKVNIKLGKKDWSKTYAIADDNRPTFCFLQIFDRRNEVLI